MKAENLTNPLASPLANPLASPVTNPVTEFNAMIDRLIHNFKTHVVIERDLYRVTLRLSKANRDESVESTRNRMYKLTDTLRNRFSGFEYLWFISTNTKGHTEVYLYVAEKYVRSIRALWTCGQVIARKYFPEEMNYNLRYFHRLCYIPGVKTWSHSVKRKNFSEDY